MATRLRRFYAALNLRSAYKSGLWFALSLIFYSVKLKKEPTWFLFYCPKLRGVSALNLYRQGHTKSMTAHPFGYPNLLPYSLH